VTTMFVYSEALLSLGMCSLGLKWPPRFMSFCPPRIITVSRFVSALLSVSSSSVTPANLALGLKIPVTENLDGSFPLSMEDICLPCESAKIKMLCFLEGMFVLLALRKVWFLRGLVCF